MSDQHSSDPFDDRTKRSEDGDEPPSQKQPVQKSSSTNQASGRGSTTKKKRAASSRRRKSPQRKRKTPPAEGLTSSFIKFITHGFGFVVAIGTVAGFGVWFGQSILTNSDSEDPQYISLSRDYDALFQNHETLSQNNERLSQENIKLLEETSDLQDEKAQHLKIIEASNRTDSLERYLTDIVVERRNDWGHKFEFEYSPATLYMLSPLAADDDSDLMAVYGRILRWRLGVEDISKKDQVLLSLTGYVEKAEALDEGTTATQYVNSRIKHILFDKDLLDYNLEENENGWSVYKEDYKGIVVLGEPASGKSTLLKYLELEAARRAMVIKSDPIPVRLELGAFKDEKGSKHNITEKLLWHEVIKRISGTSPTDEPLTDENGFTLPEGRKFLLLIDAMDETIDFKETAEAVAEISQYDSVELTIVTSRLSNYNQDLHRKNQSLSKRGFVTAILYGQSLAAIEKRIMLKAGDEKEKMLSTIAEADRRPVWLQFFRMPTHFDFARKFLSRSRIEHLAELNATTLMEYYLDSEIPRVAYEVTEDGKDQPSQDIVQVLIAEIAFWLFEDDRRNEEFSFADVKQALKRLPGYKTYSQDEAQIRAHLNIAVKVGIFNSLSESSDEFKFHHKQFWEYFTALSSYHQWKDEEITDNRWQEVLEFATGRKGDEAKELLERVVRLAEEHAAQKDENAEYLIALASSCVSQQSDTGYADLYSRVEKLRG